MFLSICGKLCYCVAFLALAFCATAEGATSSDDRAINATARTGQGRSRTTSSLQRHVGRVEVFHVEAPGSPLRTREWATDEEKLEALMEAHRRRQAYLARLAGAQQPAFAGGLAEGKALHMYFEPVTAEGAAYSMFYVAAAWGTPPQRRHVLLDTSSDLSWVQCEQCVNCFQQQEPLYDYEASSTYAHVDCGDPACARLDPQDRFCRPTLEACSVRMSRGDGSAVEASLATETFTFGGRSPPALVLPKVLLGCVFNVLSPSLSRVKAGGVLGLGHTTQSVVRALQSFSYCLPGPFSKDKGYLILNEPADEPQGANQTITTVALLGSGAWLPQPYYVKVTGIEVEGQMVAIPGSVFDLDLGVGGTIVDAGSAITSLPAVAYVPFRDAIRQHMVHVPRLSQPSSYVMDTCYVFPAEGPDPAVPDVRFLFDGTTFLALQSRNLFLSFGGQVRCLAFAPSTSTDQLISLGSVFQAGYEVEFKLSENRLQFISDSC